MTHTSISERLRERRRQLGLSLTEVARRAGTSAATLSRYEHGWTRFEVYTLAKLALALESDLHIELHPKPKPDRPAVTPEKACRRLKRLFWDRRLAVNDLKAHPVWLAERVLEFGNLDDVLLLRDAMGPDAFLETVSAIKNISPKTLNFWQKLLELEGRACTKTYSRNTAWIS